VVYRVELAPHAVRQFKRLSKQVQHRLRDVIDALAENPRPAGVAQLSGQEERLYRVREGDYRIIYRIQDDVLLVLIVGIGHRRDIYKLLLG
jgi:mRNA interferase RelE/StbE